MTSFDLHRPQAHTHAHSLVGFMNMSSGLNRQCVGDPGDRQEPLQRENHDSFTTVGICGVF